MRHIRDIETAQRRHYVPRRCQCCFCVIGIAFFAAMFINNPTDCEVRSVFRFLNAQRVPHAEIHRQLQGSGEVYGEGVMNDGSMCKWCRLFD